MPKFLLILLCTAFWLHASLVKPIVLVPTLESSGLSAGEAQTLTERLRNELSSTGKFQLIPASQMEMQTQEQADPQSGICNADDCQLQTAQALGAERLVLGHINLLADNTYTMNIRILDTRTGELLHDVNGEYQGDFAGLQSQIMPQIAARLANHTPPAQETAQTRRDSILNAAQTRPASNLTELFARLLAIPVAADRPSIAVLPFQVQGKNTLDYDPGVLAAEYATVQIGKDTRYRLVERAHLDQVLGEQALVQAGMASDSAAAESGKILSAQYLVLGSVTVQAGKQSVFARMVQVESGAVVAAATAELSDESLRELYLLSIGERTQVSAVIFRSLLAPGWGHFYAGRPVRGAFWSTLALGGIGYATYRVLDYRNADNDYSDFKERDPGTVQEGESPEQWIARANDAREKRNDAATQANIALGILGGIWLGNVLDAWWVGVQETRKIQTRYFASRITILPEWNFEYAAIRFTGSF